MNKKPVFSLAVAVYEDGTYKEQIILEPNGTQMAANVIFNIMTGQVSEGVLNAIQKKYPKQFTQVNTMVENLYEQFMETATEIMKDGPDVPCVKATEVFGGKND